MNDTTEASVLADRCSFRLAPSQLAAIRTRVASESMTMPSWFYPAMTILFGSQLGLVLARHRDSVATVVYGLILSGWVISVICVTITRSQRIPTCGDLLISADGLAGSLNEAPVRIRWWEVARVHDLDDAIVVYRRRSGSPIFIPKSGIADVPAFWSLLEDYLIANRRTPDGVAKQILNTAY